MAAEREQAADEAPAPRRGRRWLAIGLAVAVAGAGLALRQHYAWRESTDDAQVDGHVAPAAARVPGTVVAVEVADNQQVAAGAVLVRLDARDYEVALARARADLAEAESALVAARHGVPVTTTATGSAVQGAESGLTAAQARLAAARARLAEAAARDAQAAADLKRLGRLVERDEVSRQEFEAVSVGAAAARAAHEAAEAGVREAEEGVTAARARLAETRSAPEQVAIARSRAASAEARVAKERAAVARAELDLERTTVRAPRAGVVSRKTVEVGQVVQAGQPLLAVVPLDDVWVTANFKENQLRRIRPGQPVEIEVDAYAGRVWRGRVESLAAATGARFSLLPPENATGNFVKVVQRVPVKIALEAGQDPEHLLRPGLSVVPTVITR